MLFTITNMKLRRASARLQLLKQEPTRLMSLTSEYSNTNRDSLNWTAKFKLFKSRTKAIKDLSNNTKIKEEKYLSYLKLPEELTTMRTKLKLLPVKLIDWTTSFKEKIDKLESSKERLDKAKLLQNSSIKSNKNSEN